MLSRARPGPLLNPFGSRPWAKGRRPPATPMKFASSGRAGTLPLGGGTLAIIAHAQLPAPPGSLGYELLQKLASQQPASRITATGEEMTTPTRSNVEVSTAIQSPSDGVAF